MSIAFRKVIRARRLQEEPKDPDAKVREWWNEVRREFIWEWWKSDFERMPEDQKATLRAIYRAAVEIEGGS